MNMVFTYSYHTREYEDWADYDHSVSVVPYALVQLQPMWAMQQGNMAVVA